MYFKNVLVLCINSFAYTDINEALKCILSILKFRFKEVKM